MSILSRPEGTPRSVEATLSLAGEGTVLDATQAQLLGGRVVGPETELTSVGVVAGAEQVIIHDRIGHIREWAKERMTDAACTFRRTVDALPIIDVPESERATTISLRPVRLTSTPDSGWKPASVEAYASHDPFQVANPGLAGAATDLIRTTVSVAEVTGTTADATLAYLDARRSNGGKRTTVVTQAIMDIDPGIANWIGHLPDAEQLRPVAHPWSDVSTITIKEKSAPDEPLTMVHSPNTKYLSALVGGAKDGLAVREREAWEKMILRRRIDVTTLPGQTLRVTSLGTGTGEPAMDTGLDMVRDHPDAHVLVRGFDVKASALQVAEYIAAAKTRAHDDKLKFIGGMANILSRDGIAEAVGGTRAQVYEAIGFAEYVPSDFPTSEEETQQRKLMERMGCLSAEEFYGAIYENMPQGSILITGNMRNDSPEAPFVIQGLGWKGIIQRSTEEYLAILEHAGIPGDAVRLYVPDAGKSAGVYNLVAITKL